MVEQALKNAIPSQLSIFNKLTEGLDPYHFLSWDKEGDNSILRYWFWNRTKTEKNMKRIFIYELEEFLKFLLTSEEITRQDFQKFCPRTRGDGTCGFAVTFRILEYFQLAELINGKYRVINKEKIQGLLSN